MADGDSEGQGCGARDFGRDAGLDAGGAGTSTESPGVGTRIAESGFDFARGVVRGGRDLSQGSARRSQRPSRRWSYAAQGPSERPSTPSTGRSPTPDCRRGSSSSTSTTTFSSTSGRTGSAEPGPPRRRRAYTRSDRLATSTPAGPGPRDTPDPGTSPGPRTRTLGWGTITFYSKPSRTPDHTEKVSKNNPNKMVRTKDGGKTDHRFASTLRHCYSGSNRYHPRNLQLTWIQ